MNRRHLIVGIVAIVGFIANESEALKRFLRGYFYPETPIVETSNPRLLAEYPDRSPEQVAILLMSDTQDALPAARTFSPVGIPFCVTKDLAGALRHRIVFIPLGEETIHLKPDVHEQVKNFVSRGGVLILQPLGADIWPEISGIHDLTANRSRKRMAFTVKADAGFNYLRSAEQTVIPLASPDTEEGIWTTALHPQKSTRAIVLAHFPDTREPAMLRNSLGNGFVYSIGLDLRDAVVRPQSGHSFDARRMPYNGFEPAADVFPLIFRAWYERYTPDALRLRAAPGDAKAMFLLSHSIGPGTTVKSAEDFYAIELQRGVKATYFVQTKYVIDKQQSPLFNPRVFALLHKLQKTGYEIASHGVAASPELERLPMGTGEERMKTYRPEVVRYGKTYSATLLGELHVSKTLIESKIPGAKVSGFRSRLFATHELLHEALASEGYLYDSSMRSPENMTHFPFLLMEKRGMAIESGIVELPMTFEDAGINEGVVEAEPVLKALRKISDYEGVFVWLISPTAEESKVQALRAVLDGIPPGIKMMNHDSAARYWKARSKTQFWLESSRGSGRATLRLLLPEDNTAGLSFESARTLRGCAPGPGTGSEFKVRCAGKILTLERTSGAREASIDLTW